MKISVIIPTFNRRYVLHRAIESVVNQTRPPIEIIVVDDGSTDGTKDWLANSFPSVKYIYHDNKGVSSARNIGIEVSKGSWVSFLDSDDEWMPTKLEEQENHINKNPEIKFCHTNEIWIRNGVRVNQMKKHQKYGGDIFEKCLDICRISPSSVLIKKDVLDKIGLFDESLKVCEDYDMWLRWASRFSVLFLDRQLIIKYGGHSDQLSRVNSGIERYRIKSLENLLNSHILSEVQSRHARDQLVIKLKIYAKGLEKRNRLDELDTFNEKIKAWSLRMS